VDKDVKETFAERISSFSESFQNAQRTGRSGRCSNRLQRHQLLG